MGRQLSPEQNTFFIPIPLIVEVVRLVRITESIEARSLHLLHTGSHLLLAESMTLPKLVLVLAYPIQEHRFVVQIETSVTVVTFHRPADGTNTKRCSHLIRSSCAPFNHGSQTV
ncbi:hypothetical protein SDC9_168151 [bioreactor metagenome]|uniref:Uncharacterized protein n=1 Tax=bioreactor metagenome TaxID=1076179 RepID=A0A645G495_9ZZZZ